MRWAAFITARIDDDTPPAPQPSEQQKTWHGAGLWMSDLDGPERTEYPTSSLSGRLCSCRAIIDLALSCPYRPRASIVVRPSPSRLSRS